MEKLRELSLREIQLFALNIMEAFDEFCKYNGLTYSLVGGTLLGAVRHKGFIPWDDDVDVGMPRPDYERFVELMRQRGNKLTDDYVIRPDRGDGAICPFIKIEDTRISIPQRHSSISQNLWIDVFPFDGCPADAKKAKKLFKKAKHYRHIIVYNHFKFSHFKGIKKPLYMLYSIYARTFGLQRAINKLHKLACSCPCKNAERVAGVVWGLYGMGEIISGNSFEQTVELEFEGKCFSAIHNWDEYLTGLYGDYMTPPPENKRQSHKLIAYINENNEGDKKQ